MTSRLGLNIDAIFAGALDGSGHVRGVIRSKYGGGDDGDVEVVRLHPRAVVKGVTRERDALEAPVADA